MARSRTAPLVALLLAGALVLGACGSDGGGDDDAATTTAAADGTTTTAGADGATATTAAPGSSDTTAPATDATSGPGAAALGDLASTLADGDLGCDTVDGQRQADGAQGAAQCDLSTDNPAYLYTFDDNDQRDAFIDGGGVIDCTFIFGSGVTFDYVVADKVIIRPEENDDAQAIADAVDGEVRTLSCEAPAG